MRDLHEGVDAGVGAAGSGHFDRMIRDGRQRAFQRVLDAPRVRLRLPSGKRGSVVLDSQRYPDQRRLRAGST
jgi:hypothetical protein